MSEHPDMSLSPAALAALAAGDLENAIVATTPGGVEAQELGAQLKMVSQFDTLPIDMGSDGRAIAEALGFSYGETVDDLFVSVAPPLGWSLKASEHAMHSAILDQQGRVRGSIFYKAAFYDRRADGYWLPRYRMEALHENGTYTAQVIDASTGQAVWSGSPCNDRDYAAYDREDEAAQAWISNHYPDRHPLAYW